MLFSSSDICMTVKIPASFTYQVNVMHIRLFTSVFVNESLYQPLINCIYKQILCQLLKVSLYSELSIHLCCFQLAIADEINGSFIIPALVHILTGVSLLHNY